mmetsp:Transcript_29041/g.43803  ORF Transcript_29041/g.43803 Transcript_29041/m.43803 type:complete len:145 (-) Transcript_29041:1303-1737(-)
MAIGLINSRVALLERTRSGVTSHDVADEDCSKYLVTFPENKQNRSALIVYTDTLGSKVAARKIVLRSKLKKRLPGKIELATAGQDRTGEDPTQMQDMTFDSNIIPIKGGTLDGIVEALEGSDEGMETQPLLSRSKDGTLGLNIR